MYLTYCVPLVGIKENCFYYEFTPRYSQYFCLKRKWFNKESTCVGNVLWSKECRTKPSVILPIIDKKIQTGKETKSKKLIKLSSFRIILIHGKTRFILATAACRSRTGEQLYRCSLQCLPLQK